MKYDPWVKKRRDSSLTKRLKEPLVPSLDNSGGKTTLDLESLADTPSGGRVKMWLVGAVIALIPFVYGLRCLVRGSAWFPGRYGYGLTLTGWGAASMAIAYMCIGAFIHFHYFWGIHPRLQDWSYPLKVAAGFVFVVSLGYASWLILIS